MVEAYVLLFSRLTIAVVFLYYGLPKIKDLRSNAEDFNKMGFKPGLLFGTLMAALEVGGGIAMLLGFLAELAGILLAIAMLIGTIWKLKVKKEFPHYSYDIILLALCLVITVFGPGAAAVLPLV